MVGLGNLGVAQQLPIPPNLDPSFECYVIRWPDDPLWRSFLLGFFDSMQFGPTWDGQTGSVTDVLAVGREIYIENYQLEEAVLGCNDVNQLVVAINGLSASAFASSDCSPCDTGSRGLGAESPEENNEPLVDDGVEEPPEGYGSWAEYDTYKCGAATLIIDNMIRDLGEMDGMTLFGLSALDIALGIAAVILTPIPADDILAIAAIILAIIAIATDVFGNAQTLLNNNKDEFVCVLYEANSVSSAIAGFNGLVDEKADALYPTNPGNYYIKTLLSYMAGPGNFNRLVERDNFQELPVGDCSGCGVCLPIWCYDTDAQGWTFSDAGTDPGAFAFGSYNAVNEALNTNLQLPSVANISAVGTWTKVLPSGTFVQAGDTLQADLMATSDGNQTQFRFELKFTDATEEIGSNQLWSSATQLQHTVVASNKELEEIRVVVSRTTGAGAFGSASNNYLEQYSMDLSDPGDCPVGPCDA